jgi:hypothetical protein
MESSLKIIVVILSVVLSFFLGHYFSSGTTNIVKEKEIIIKEVPKEITKEVLVENRVDVEAAKKYYEKAFKLFLINIGHSLNQKQESDFQEMIDSPKSYMAKEQNQDQIQREFDFIPTDSFKKYIAKNEADLRNITDESLLKNNQKFVLKDPPLYFIRSKMINKFDEIKHINGEYRAELFRIVGNNKGRVDSVYLQADYTLKDENTIDGSFTLKLSHADKVYSNSSGNGGNGNIRINKGDIVIKAGPSNFFHFKGKNLGEANFYSNGKLAGIARFQKI